MFINTRIGNRKGINSFIPWYVAPYYHFTFQKLHSILTRWSFFLIKKLTTGSNYSHTKLEQLKYSTARCKHGLLKTYIWESEYFRIYFRILIMIIVPYALLVRFQHWISQKATKSTYILKLFHDTQASCNIFPCEIWDKKRRGNDTLITLHFCGFFYSWFLKTRNGYLE